MGGAKTETGAPTGGDAILRTARAAGVEICFANPGTTELALVSALDRAPGIRPVLCLFEGVCSGAADGWARMMGRPAATLLHLGPGVANAGANLHNARRARVPMLNLVGDHARWHAPFDPLLASDVDGLARAVGDTVVRCHDAGLASAATARALEAALAPPGHVATLIVPDDVQAGAAGEVLTPVRPAARARVPEEVVERVARALTAGDTALLLGGAGATAAGLAAAGRIARRGAARLFCETFPARVERGGSHPALDRFPYFPEQALAALAGVRTLVLAGAREPVAFFGYPGQPSLPVPEGCTVLVLARPDEDAALALEALADALPRGDERPPAPGAPRATRPTGKLDPVSLGLVLAALQPEGAIVVDESLTSGGPWFGAARSAPAHTVLALTGGAIGAGLPLATGAALAAPDRPVIALQADGSGLYTLQSLWTQAREGLHVVSVICANRGYRILQAELARAGVTAPGPAARGFTDLSHPTPDWVALARGFGVPGRRVETAEALAQSLEAALREPGPHLVEAVL